MKWVTELHDCCLNKPIWIVGSDSTIDEYPDNFLDNKIGITLHLAHLKFPNATYRHFNEYDRLKYLVKKDLSILKKDNIFAWPFFRRTEEKSSILTQGTERGYYFKLRPYPPDGNPDDWTNNTAIGLKAMKRMVFEAKKGKRIVFGGYGTCLHACLFIAIMMGGNPINIIGCGLSVYKGKEHFVKVNKVDRKMRPDTVSFSDPKRRSDRMIEGTLAIIEACEELGIEVNWYKRY